jgi:rubredoxin
MDEKRKSVETQIMMKCKSCGYRATQSEIDENDGICPGCDEEFQPLDDRPARKTQ